MTAELAPAEVAALRRRVVEARTETKLRIIGLTRDFDAIVASAEGSNADDEHDPEGHTIGFERAQVSALVTEASDRLAALERAAVRLDDGTSGRCDTCGRPIGFERLLAAPTTTVCIDCAQSVEQMRRRLAGRGR